MKEYGRVEWFDRKLGYGFISRKDKPDIFVHYSEIDLPGEGDKRFLAPGDVVEFVAKNIQRDNKTKWQACEVAVVNSAEHSGGCSEAVS